MLKETKRYVNWTTSQTGTALLANRVRFVTPKNVSRVYFVPQHPLTLFLSDVTHHPVKNFWWRQKCTVETCQVCFWQFTCLTEKPRVLLSYSGFRFSDFLIYFTSEILGFIFNFLGLCSQILVYFSPEIL